jgi:hypothetical protein
MIKKIPKQEPKSTPRSLTPAEIAAVAGGPEIGNKPPR